MVLESTNSVDIGDFDAFYRHYYEPALSVLRSVGVPEHDVDPVAQEFFARVWEKDLLARPGQIHNFRSWFFASLANQARDYFRGRARSGRRVEEQPPDATDPRPAPGWPGHAVDEDSLYALCILNMTLQKMRFHCETTGKPEIWQIFDHWLRARLEDRPRHETGDRLVEQFPDRDRAFVWDRLASGRRMFRRMVREVIPPSLSDHADPGGRFQEWLEIMQSSPAAREGRLHLAFRTDAAPPPGASEVQSINLAMRDEFFGDLEAAPTDPDCRVDELRILLSFRMSTPLEYYIPGIGEDARRRSTVGNPRPGRPDRPGRPLCLESLLTPAPDDPSSYDEGLFREIKKGAKWNRKAGGDELLGEVSAVIYNLAIALALDWTGSRITELPDSTLAANLHWAMSRPWLDDRLRPAFERALHLIDAGRCDGEPGD